MNRSAGTPPLDGIESARLLTADIMRAVTAQAVVALDADGEIVCCNDTALRLHGRTSGQAAATGPSAGLYGPPLNGSGPDAPIGPLLRRLSAGGTWTGQVACRHASGSTVTADMAVTRRHPAAGDAPAGFILVYQPSSALGASPPAADQQPVTVLPSAPLLSMLGHELRSPLTAIIGLARMLLRRLSIGPPDPESQTRQLLLLLTSASQMLRLTDRVADIARLQAGLARPAPTSIDCRDVVTETVRTQQPAADARDLRLLVEGPDEPVPLTCEASLLVRLVQELIDNAMKYTDGADVRIRVSAQSHGAVTIEVANDGPVIPAGERTRIFGPFERGNAGTARDEGGAGLGLYLARQLANELGAGLCLRSEAHHRDTTFAIEIPRRDG
jgi:two-component sensor histidine kinase